MQVQVYYNVSLCLKCHYVTFRNINDLYKKTNTYIKAEYDFIVSSKLINEIINENKISYLDFYTKYSKHLSSVGLILMLDVTTKIGDLDYLPILLNNQTNIFIQKNLDNFKSLVPNICYENDNTCNYKCFSNNVFEVIHSRKINDVSSVTYRIIGRKKYVERIKKVSNNIGGIIGWNKNKTPERYCPYATISTRCYNSYKV